MSQRSTNYAVASFCLAIGFVTTFVQSQELAPAVSHAKALSQAFRLAAEDAAPSVVTIRSKFNLNRGDRAEAMHELLQDPRFRGLFPEGRAPFPIPGEGGGEPGFGENVGSGVVIDKAGIILTNNHVVADADEVTVRFPDGSELIAKEIKTDHWSDLAILRVEPVNELTAARLGNSEALDIGDWVIAIGSPFELEATVSAGIISGKWVLRELLEFGTVHRAYLGIRIGELTPQAAGQLKLPARSGVWVLATVPNGPAAEAGIAADDVIVEFAGTPVRSPGDLQDVVEQKPIGSTQEVIVLREGTRISHQVKMVALPDEL